MSRRTSSAAPSARNARTCRTAQRPRLFVARRFTLPLFRSQRRLSSGTLAARRPMTSRMVLRRSAYVL